MPDKDQIVPLPFPERGVDLSHGFGLAAPGTTPIGTNVRFFEPTTLRARGGSRAGAAQYIPALVGSASLIQDLNSCVFTDVTGLQDAGPPPPNTLFLREELPASVNPSVLPGSYFTIWQQSRPAFAGANARLLSLFAGTQQVSQQKADWSPILGGGSGPQILLQDNFHNPVPNVAQDLFSHTMDTGPGWQNAGGHPMNVLTGTAGTPNTNEGGLAVVTCPQSDYTVSVILTDRDSGLTGNPNQWNARALLLRYSDPSNFIYVILGMPNQQALTFGRVVQGVNQPYQTFQLLPPGPGADVFALVTVQATGPNLVLTTDKVYIPPFSQTDNFNRTATGLGITMGPALVSNFAPYILTLGPINKWKSQNDVCVTSFLVEGSIVGAGAQDLGFAQFLSPRLSAQTVPSGFWTLVWGVNVENCSSANTYGPIAALYLVNGKTGQLRLTLINKGVIGSATRILPGEFSVFGGNLSTGSFTVIGGDYLCLEVGFRCATSNVSWVPITDLFTSGVNASVVDNAPITSVEALVGLPANLSIQ